MKKLLMTGVAAVAAITFSPLAHAEVGDQSDAEQAVRTIYNQVQTRCTPSMHPSFQSISWSTFFPDSWGEGRIIDSNSALGGSFKVTFTNPRVGPAHDNSSIGRADGQWNVDLQFC
jgi:hypothetical protein